ncbi:hypothetical protein, partial [Enterobacter quasiroggenkampii]|uniref:hypothetical protein n=1 Tax=Enterobacter quasiroggenkampii TaxID=2497436 RepID=UPI0021D29F97
MVMVQGMRARLSKRDLIVDAITADKMKLATNEVATTGNKNAHMSFRVDNSKDLADKTGTILLEVDGFFHGALKACQGLKLMTRLYMYFADKL